MELDLRPEDIGNRVFQYGQGCDYCNNTGYKGRLGIYEILVMDDTLRELVMRQASAAVIRQEAVKRGMRPLRDGGLLGIYDGITTIEEVVKETILGE